VRDRIELVEKEPPDLSMRQQCTLVSVARSGVDYVPVAESEEGLRIKRLLDEIYVIDPCRRSRSLVIILKRDYSVVVNRKRVQRLRREMGLETIYCQPRTSIPGDGHRRYP
jgi:putative transposase